MARVIKTTPFDFNELYQDIKQQYAERGYDVAEGSNTSMLTTAQAYMAASINQISALNANESLLPFAQKRENVLNNARVLGYEIRHKTSYIYNLTLSIPIITDKVVIPKYALFTSGDYAYYYFGDDIILSPNESLGGEKDFREVKIQVKEGVLYNYVTEESLNYNITSDIAELTDYYVDIPYTDIEEEGIECFVTYYDDYGIFHDHEMFVMSDKTILEKDETFIRKYVRIDDIQFGTPRLYFKYAGAGLGLKAGSTVNVNVLESSGSLGEANGDFVSLNGFEVTEYSLAQRGQDEESTSSIKTNAPKVYNSANRLVTENDYEAACNRDTRVKLTSVWGGEKEFPVSPGHIWFSFLPPQVRTFSEVLHSTKFTRDNFENFWMYTDKDASDKAIKYYENNYLMNDSIRSSVFNNDGKLISPGIWDKLDEMHIPTLVYHTRHPIFLEYIYNVTILKYLISDEMSTIHKEIFDIIDSAFTGDDNIFLENFNTEYFNASMIKRIDERVTDISGFELELTNRLVLNSKSVCVENENSDIRDIYIPLSIPYEKYFDNNGCLIIDYLPKIDTKDFIQYMGETGKDLFVDWSKIQKDIDNLVPQNTHKLIIAPIKCRLNSIETFDSLSAQNHELILRHEIYPDSFGAKNVTESYQNQYVQDNLVDGVLPTDFVLPEVPTYNGVTVTLKRIRGRDVLEDIIPHDPYKINGWYLETENKIVFTPNIDIRSGDDVQVDLAQTCGFYYIFNSLKREILVHLLVDGKTSGFEEYMKGNLQAVGNEFYLFTTDNDYIFSNTHEYLYCEAEYDEDTKYAETRDTTPKSYLFSVDSKYMHTPDNYYLTTEGYAIKDPNEVNSYTGSVVREVNPNMYRNSPLKADLFYRNRYLNLHYNTKNFRTSKNVISMLKSVEFHNVIN